MLTPRQIALRWIDSFNQHDVLGLIALYSRHAMHTSPKLRIARPESHGEIVGVHALVEWWQDTFRRLPGLRYTLIRMTCSSERALIEYVRHIPGEDPTIGAEVFDVQSGLIIASRVYNG